MNKGEQLAHNKIFFAFILGGPLRPSTNAPKGHTLARGAHLMDDGVACCIKLSEIEAATMKFSKNIGKGSFGVVYYGRMNDGKEVAVKIIGDPTSQGTKQFLTEVR